MRVKTISWAAYCYLHRSAVGHRHSNHRAGVRPWKPQGQSLPPHHAGPCWTTCETRGKKLSYQSDPAKDIFSVLSVAVSVKVRMVSMLPVMHQVKAVTVPVPCQHDVIFVKLLPAVVLS